jgi:tRNA-splicing ligase RtcB
MGMMKARDLLAMGYKPGPAIGVALDLIGQMKSTDEETLRQQLSAVVSDPSAYRDDSQWAPLAEALIEHEERQAQYVERADPAPYRIWGEGLEAGALDQMKNAARLPIAIAGALMPDAHQGYGLPIGGVLATENAVIPYAVGVDIACRMKLSVFDLPATDLKRLAQQLEKVLARETVFGVGAVQRKRADHPVLESDWSVSPVAQHNYEKAADQLGTSGSGNHFVEFGILTISSDELGAPLSLPAGQYLALLSHSGSRGTGAAIANHYSKLAMSLHPELPAQLRYLAWLDMDSDPGREYFAAMNLMGEYASANHAIIHQKIARAIDSKVIAGVENHHNFAWKEIHLGRELIVHRKGATPGERRAGRDSRLDGLAGFCGAWPGCGRIPRQCIPWRWPAHVAHRCAKSVSLGAF